MSEPPAPTQYAFLALLLALALVVGTLLALEIGRAIGRRNAGGAGEGASIGTGTVEAAVFGLLGLLIAFTFSGAAARFDVRRQLIVEEANDIGTAYRRLDLLPVDAQPELRALFRRYLDARLATYRKLPDLAAAQAELAESLQLQDEIWQKVVAGSQRASNSSVAVLLIPAVNAVFDIATTRTTSTWMHPPWIIYGMLFALALTSALVAGYGMAAAPGRSLVHMLTFAIALGLSSYVILDMEFPRLGFIQVNEFDRALVDVRQSMK